MKRIVIFGCLGATGQAFIEFLAQNNQSADYQIYGIDVGDCVDQRIKYFKKDLLKPGNIHDLLDKIKPNYILNCVGIFSANEENPLEKLIQINAFISDSILSACLSLRLPIDKILLIGSAAEYGIPQYLPVDEIHPTHPVNLYGLSKQIQTNIMQYYASTYSLNVCLARTFNIIGKRMSQSLSIGSFYNQLQSINEATPGILHVGNLHSKRDFLDISDIVKAYWFILQYGIPGEIYNVCSGYSIMMQDIVEKMIKASKKNVSVSIKDERIIQKTKKRDIEDIYGTNSKLLSLGWSPIYSVDESIDLLFS